MTAAPAVPARFQALLVDLDGTLLDTTVAVEASWRRLAADLEVDFATFEPFLHGIPATQVLDHVLPWLPTTERSRFADQVLADQARDDAVVHWMPGAEQFVGQLQGLPWAVVTSGTRRLAESSMRKVRMSQPPVMVTADDVGIGKPHPAPFLRAAHLLRTSPSDCLALEDSPAGVSSARQAGVSVVAVPGTYPRSRLRDATVILDRLPQLEVDPVTRTVALKPAAED